jgi:hypothetical protein
MNADAEVVTFGALKTGLWCERCNLPSLLRQEVKLVVGMKVADLPPYEMCTEHGEPG